MREQIVRVFAVSKSILAWRGPSPARPDEILAARHAAAIMPDQITGASDLGERLEQAVHMALNEVVAILGFSLNPDDRAFATILKAKTTILSSVLSAQVRIDETGSGQSRKTGSREFWPPPSARYLIWRGHTGANAPKLVDSYIGE